MFRTFRSNPALGGFGSESSSSELHDDASTPDAFCQIIKELVDNAIDACSAADVGAPSRNKENKSTGKMVTKATGKGTNVAQGKQKRVRVVIQTFNDNRKTQDSCDEVDQDISAKQEVLRVTVSDNGCGMADIQRCVDAFRTSKAHSSNDEIANELNTNGAKSKPKGKEKTPEPQTAGRYGIGLTLCLLHAQRLVPDSCASIQSAVAADTEWTSVTAVVDTGSDAVRCFARKSAKKSNPTESGTSISVLVPGGPSATLAWPRLAEYFARFKLSMGMTCSVEVLAPTLSRIPLMVQQMVSTSLPSGLVRSEKSAKKSPFAPRNDCGVDLFHCESSDSASDSEDDVAPTDAPSKERLAICEATRRFLGRPVNVENVAHICVPIRNKKGKQSARPGPMLEVDVIVHGPHDDDSDNDSDDDTSLDADRDESMHDENATVDAESVLENVHDTASSASMVLVRMVNKIPLLDSSEAAACGLVLGLSSKKRMWNSFGLDVSMKHDAANVDKLPTFDVVDSEQVAPFLKKGAHELFESETQQESDEASCATGTKRKKEHRARSLLPASIRLGNILVIAQIHAEPTMLPLPTLSKGRLPIDNKAIDDALELGMTLCLRQLQKTNESLLLTASELRVAERDSRYVPAVSMALASILARSTTCAEPVQRILDWETPLSESNRTIMPSSQTRSQLPIKPEVLGKLIEERLRLVLESPRKSKKKRKSEQIVDDDLSLEAARQESLEVNSVSEQSNAEETADMLESAVSSTYIPSKSSSRVVGKSCTTYETDYDDWL